VASPLSLIWRTCSKRPTGGQKLSPFIAGRWPSWKRATARTILVSPSSELGSKRAKAIKPHFRLNPSLASMQDRCMCSELTLQGEWVDCSGAGASKTA
jgi:hypothetical protein